MEFLLVKFIPCKTYLSLVDPNGKSRFACFSERDVGINCIKYIDGELSQGWKELLKHLEK